MLPNEGEYKCLKCGSLGPFFKNRRRSNNLSIWCKDCTGEYRRSHYLTNKKRYNKMSADYYKANQDSLKEARQEWEKNNVPIRRSITNQRRAAMAAVKLDEEYRKQIKEIYRKAKEAGKVVDHIIPLKGRTVCGLHVPWNLQLLDALDNARKFNKLQTK